MPDGVVTTRQNPYVISSEKLVASSPFGCPSHTCVHAGSSLVYKRFCSRCFLLVTTAQQPPPLLSPPRLSLTTLLSPEHFSSVNVILAHVYYTIDEGCTRQTA
jgi:hypothetical protein